MRFTVLRLVVAGGRLGHGWPGFHHDGRVEISDWFFWFLDWLRLWFYNRFWFLNWLWFLDWLWFLE